MYTAVYMHDIVSFMLHRKQVLCEIRAPSHYDTSHPHFCIYKLLQFLFCVTFIICFSRALSTFHLQAVVRQICTTVNSHFQLLAAQQEARERAKQSQVQQQMKPKMIKRISAIESPKKTSPPTTPRERSPTRKISPSKSKRVAPRQPSPEVPMETGEQFDFDFSTNQEWILHDWSTSSVPPQQTEESELLQEIGQQFLAVAKEPSRRRAQPRYGPNLKRLSVEHAPSGGFMGKKKAQNRAAQHHYMSVESDEMVQPLHRTETKKHDGNVVTQTLEDTTGISVSDYPDIVLVKNKPRTSVITADLTPKTSPKHASPSKQPASSPQRGVPAPPRPPASQGPPAPPPPPGAPAPPPPPPVAAADPNTEVVLRSPSKEKREDRSVLHTSLLLESMEEGELETRIDGNGGSAVLIQTTMGEKETALVGTPTTLLPASELKEYEDSEKKMNDVKEDR